MKFSHLEFKEVKGVGSIEVDFTPDKKVHVFIGENGVGKTKFLEALFQLLLLSNPNFKKHYKLKSQRSPIVVDNIEAILSSHFENSAFSKIIVDDFCVYFSELRENFINKNDSVYFKEDSLITNSKAIIFISAKERGFIESTIENKNYNLKSFTQRRSNYIGNILDEIIDKDDFSSLRFKTDIEHWFVSIAQSSNPFQKKRDNREIEIRTVLKLCHQIDNSIDPDFMEIGGGNRVFLKINDEVTQLSHLSTGYASILKIIQSIISGYGYFTNEQQLQNVRGTVFIDEIESHLHLSWQSKIIPALKELFPNTTFYITTHSPIVLTQLESGEAYKLQREQDGVVRSVSIKNPSNAAFVDMLDDAFDLDVNKIKLEQVSTDGQKEAKQRLLDLINKQREASIK